MQFTLTDLQNEIKENSNKLLKENIDLLETIQKVDENCRIDKKVWCSFQTYINEFKKGKKRRAFTRNYKW